MRTASSPARAIVMGGGFAGLYAASYLAAADLPDGAVDVTLVSDTNHFTFTPLLAEVVGGGLGSAHVTVPYRSLASRRGFRFVLARIEAIDGGTRTIHTTAGPIGFDYGVVALGSRPNYFGDDELARTTLPLATVDDALALQRRVIAMAEGAERETDPDRRRRKLTFAVAGAGPAGVEVASELRHVLARVLPRHYGPAMEGRVILVDGGAEILRGWDRELAARGARELERRGVELRLSTRVVEFDGRTVRATREGTETSFDAGTLIWTAGMVPATRSLAGRGMGVDAGGRLRVRPTLEIEGCPGVFAAGDVSGAVNARTDTVYPSTAPIAISQGIRAAANIENAIAGRALEDYRAHPAGKIVSLGAGSALADILGLRLRGRPAWWLYRTAYLLKLVGARNKVRAGVALMLNTVFDRDVGYVRADEF